MSVSLEKTPMPSEEVGKSAVDYEGMLQEAQPDLDAGRVQNVDKAHDMANAGKIDEQDRVNYSDMAIRRAVKDESNDSINEALRAAESGRKKADDKYAKVDATYARIEDLKR
jgi:hypothetical protein